MIFLVIGRFLVFVKFRTLIRAVEILSRWEEDVDRRVEFGEKVLVIIFRKLGG